MTDGIERQSADEWAKDGTYRRIYNLARSNNHAQLADIVAAELDAKDARIAEAEALLRECAERLERNVNENESLRAKVAELEQRAADVDSVSKAEFQRLDAKVGELQAISDVWHARLLWARTQAWASVLGSQFMRDDAEERKAEYEALLAKLPKESRP